MKSLAGVYLKSDIEESMENGKLMYPFMLIFPDKRRIYYLKSLQDKEMWTDAIKKSIGFANLLDFYDLKETLGKGKYGVVKKAIHKHTEKECAVKLVKKKDLSIKDMELLRREIEVLKVC
jgi:serine/threonine protein kinase